MAWSLTGASAVALAAVLAVAARAKLTDRGATAAGFDRLGLPVPGVLAWAVPAVELAVAVALLAVPAWGGVAAFALLAGFTAYLAAVVRSGRVVACGCFGSRGDHPVSGVDLARNAALLVAAGAATVHRGALEPTVATVASAAVALAAGAAALRWLGRDGRGQAAGRATWPKGWAAGQTGPDRGRTDG